MLSDRLQHPDLIAHFYEAAARPERWPERWDAALAALCDAFEAEAGVLFHQPRAESAPRLLALNPRSAASSTICHDTFLTDSFHAGPDERGALHRLRASVDLDGGARAGLRLLRPTGAAAFDEGERTALDRVAQHLAAALRLEARLAVERLGSASRGAALDQLRHGALIVTGRSEILFANFAAESMAEGGGLRLGAGRNLVSCADAGEAAALAALVRAAARGRAGGSLRISRGPGKPILAATVTALPLSLAADIDATRALALIIVRDLGATSDAGQAEFMSLFGLTGAEAALVPQLLAGDTASVIAKSRGVSAATVRAQVARILDKTGAANLRALAAMISAW
jgi:DNA-binding NarL/FixJ family response regulator